MRQPSTPQSTVRCRWKSPEHRAPRLAVKASLIAELLMFLVVILLLFSAAAGTDYTHRFTPCEREGIVSSAKHEGQQQQQQQRCSALHLFLSAQTYSISAMVSKHMALDLDALPGRAGGAIRDADIRRIHIHLNNSSSGDGDTGRAMAALEDAVDAFVAPRPWWSIDPAGSASSRQVILTRWPFLELRLRLLASVQYPPASVCSKTAMSVGRQSCIHPGWGSVIENYNKATTLDIGRYNVFAVHHIASEPNAFITPADCAKPNMWNCAFLPLTNCTLPTAVTSCQSKLCLVPEREMFSELFLPASEDGVPVSRDRLPSVRVPESETQARLQALLADSGESSLRFSYPLWGGRLSGPEVAPSDWVFAHMMLLRTTRFYRGKVREAAASLQQLSGAPDAIFSSSGCVAAHIRRGDRVHYMSGSVPVNMDEYCHNATIGGECVGEGGALSRCPALNSLADFGCAIDANSRGNRPFASVTLPEIIARAAELVAGNSSSSRSVKRSVRNIFVMTDDYEWLRNQSIVAAARHPSWRVYALPPPRRQLFGQSRDYHYVRSSAGTASGALLHASIQLATSCQAFVGHFGSSIAHHIYRSMCFRHGPHRAPIFGACPPALDVGRHQL